MRGVASASHCKLRNRVPGLARCPRALRPGRKGRGKKHATSLTFWLSVLRRKTYPRPDSCNVVNAAGRKEDKTRDLEINRPELCRLDCSRCLEWSHKNRKRTATSSE
ncbi:hypothetical protein NDU88_000425 [Pleurodeles waltl]|uniref:Uncharacterized protein n=1 Tax=Pleurodeles waltl TaxID=8319 RepID=A0AAV7U734_PLEWA|nr:hypothetical protein NDU88_000425 [Pleurodeles waltl]